MARDALKVGVAGLGAVGLGVARRLDAGIPGLVLAAVAVRDRDKARRNLPGIGERAAAGDLYLIVRVLPHPLFERQDNDVRVKLPVELTTAVLGGEVTVPTPPVLGVVRLPTVGVALAKAVPAGSGSVTTTPCAGCGPLLVTTSV